MLSVEAVNKVYCYKNMFEYKSDDRARKIAFKAIFFLEK